MDLIGHSRLLWLQGIYTASMALGCGRFSAGAPVEGANGRESSPFTPTQDSLTQRDLEAAIAASPER
jgi:hypothetical protein